MLRAGPDKFRVRSEQVAEILFAFCPVNNAQFGRFPVGKFFYDIWTQQLTSTGEPVKTWKVSEQNNTIRDRFSK